MEKSKVEEIKLSEACIINPPKSEVKALEDLESSFVPMADLNEDKIYFFPKEAKKIQDVYRGYTYFKDGDVLLAKVTPCFENGKAGVAKALVNGVGFGSSEFIVLRPKHSLLPEYLYYSISTPKFRSEGAKNMSGAVGLKRLTKDFLHNYKIPVPNVKVQQQLVEKLDKLLKRVDKAISLVEVNMINTNSLLASTLNVVFGDLQGKYEQRPLGTFDKIASGGTPLRSNPHFWGGTIPWITSGELNETYINNSIEFITELGLQNSNAKLFPAGTLLCGMYDTAAMKMSILTFDATCNQAIVGIKPKEEELDVLFLKYQLEYLKPMVLEQRQGVRQQNLNAAKIKAILVTVPPLHIQLRIKNYILQLENKQLLLISKLNQKHTYLKALKASILDAAFKGELNNASIETLAKQTALVG